MYISCIVHINLMWAALLWISEKPNAWNIRNEDHENFRKRKCFSSRLNWNSTLYAFDTSATELSICSAHRKIMLVFQHNIELVCSNIECVLVQDSWLKTCIYLIWRYFFAIPSFLSSYLFWRMTNNL